MSKRLIKIIKGTDSKPKEPTPPKERTKKKRSIEGTIQNWVTERREKVDTEDRTRNSQFAAWNTDASPA